LFKLGSSLNLIQAIFMNIFYLCLVTTIWGNEAPTSQILSQNSLVRFANIIDRNPSPENDAEFEKLLNEKPQVLYRDGLHENLIHLLVKKNNLKLLNSTINFVDKLDTEKQSSALLYNNMDKDTPLMVSIMRGANNSFLILMQQLKKNPSIFLNALNALNIHHQNVLHYAVTFQNDLAFNNLLQESALFQNRQNWINLKDNLGKTSFYKATANENLDYMHKLATIGCDINIANLMGNRAIDLARDSDNQALRDFFGLKKSFFTRCFAHVHFRR
jgi:ankyrin repeat protein